MVKDDDNGIKGKVSPNFGKGPLIAPAAEIAEPANTKDKPIALPAEKEIHLEEKPELKMVKDLPVKDKTQAHPDATIEMPPQAAEEKVPAKNQAVEAKEGVSVRHESFTWATITFQNFFRMYNKLAGMTGTAETEAEEFGNIYELEVIRSTSLM